MIIRIIIILALVSSFISCSDLFNDSDDEATPTRSWQLLGLENESIHVIKADPHNSNILYAGGIKNLRNHRNGGLFRSMNNGEDWDTLFHDLTVRDFDIDPVNPDILYITSDFLYKSTDGGQSWIELINLNSLIGIEEILYTLTIDPNDPDVLYMGGTGFMGGDMYKSQDGGESWEVASDSTFSGLALSSIEVKPSDLNVVYVSCGSFGAVFKSVNASESWVELDFPELCAINCLHINSQNDNVLYAGCAHYGFYRSLDGGESWQEENGGIADSEHFQVYQMVSSENKIFITAKNDSKMIMQSDHSLIEWSEVGDFGSSEALQAVEIRGDGTLLAGAHGVYAYLED